MIFLPNNIKSDAIDGHLGNVFFIRNIATNLDESHNIQETNKTNTSTINLVLIIPSLSIFNAII